ncbi:hypothetical protein BDV28DRAFT_85766 [Aspergillus coremiiformis]|uniref:Uncharacterized protein n=1 Tax=Aspergillus coremiiformis TaxID=138285 RepID=A0A5N6ZAX8_9EURO|nr:hypothetical protein BDV28DRAFT_85766 [Aspergillus coremiiformis]
MYHDLVSDSRQWQDSSAFISILCCQHGENAASSLTEDHPCVCEEVNLRSLKLTNRPLSIEIPQLENFENIPTDIRRDYIYSAVSSY